jgi:hypothetical protein
MTTLKQQSRQLLSPTIEERIDMDYRKLLEMIPNGKWEIVSDKLIDFILASKNDDKMPGHLANVILSQWQNDTLKSETGITALLRAAVLLEPEKTTTMFNELQMANVAEQIKETLGS